MTQQDIAHIDHWDSYYQKNDIVYYGWKPVSYNERALEYFLLKEVNSFKPQSIMEVGCGNSTWLPYLHRKTGASVSGIEYSLRGCHLIEQQLQKENISGKIYCMDLFNADPKETGQFDFVYSLGLVEHYRDINDIIRQLMLLVKPGGKLFTEVPNLFSFHGLLCKMHQPELYKKHKILSKRMLNKAYRWNNMSEVKSKHIGLFSLDIVAWGDYPRFPSIAPYTASFVKKISKTVNKIMNRIGIYKGFPFFSSYIYCIGKK